MCPACLRVDLLFFRRAPSQHSEVQCVCMCGVPTLFSSSAVSAFRLTVCVYVCVCVEKSRYEAYPPRLSFRPSNKSIANNLLHHTQILRPPLFRSSLLRDICALRVCVRTYSFFVEHRLSVQTYSVCMCVYTHTRSTSTCSTHTLVQHIRPK